MYFVCCKVLGVSPGADEETIKIAYRKAAKELHPDLNDSEKAEEYFIMVQNAYEYLLTHRYTEEELKILWLQRQRDKKIHELKTQPRGKKVYHRSRTERFTLREVLNESRTARIIYLAFHVLFLFIGIWLMVFSVIDVIMHEPSDRVNPISAYATVTIGFLIGFLLTSTFVVTGISYLRNR